jgi:hypothetical protein
MLVSVRHFVGTLRIAGFSGILGWITRKAISRFALKHSQEKTPRNWKNFRNLRASRNFPGFFVQKFFLNLIETNQDTTTPAITETGSNVKVSASHVRKSTAKTINLLAI